MLKRFFFAATIVMAVLFMSGCEKFPDLVKYEPVSLFKFTANGVADSIIGTFPTNPLMDVSISPIKYDAGPTPFIRYKLSAFRKNPKRELDDDYRIQFHLTTETLQVQSYSYTFPGNPRHYNFKSSTGLFDDSNFSSFSPDDEFTVTVTRIENGYASGTFSGKISNDRCYQAPGCTLPKLLIENGVFERVPIRE